MHYKHFDLRACAERSLNYLTTMVDPANDNLPYWLILPNKKPAEAAHCRVDDAELVASWYEGLDATMRILGDGRGADVLASFRRYVLSDWGPKGLRYHRKFAWTHTMHSSFHEMGYVLSALNRMVRNDPNDKEADKRAAGLVRGMRSLVIERKVRTFWSGDSEEPAPIYEFPNDVYLLEGGFDLTRHTGRGEQCIRNGVMLEALVDRYFVARRPLLRRQGRGRARPRRRPRQRRSRPRPLLQLQEGVHGPRPLGGVVRDRPRQARPRHRKQGLPRRREGRLRLRPLALVVLRLGPRIRAVAPESTARRAASRT